MTTDAGSIAATIESGDTDEINELLDDLEALDVDERIQTFEDSYESLLDCMDLDDGYSRQAAVRVVSTLDPGTGRMAIEAGASAAGAPDDEVLDDAIDRAAVLFVAALADDDGRVRRAAVRGLKSLCIGCRLVGDRDTVEQVIVDLDVVQEAVDDEQRKHVEEAREIARGQLH